MRSFVKDEQVKIIKGEHLGKVVKIIESNDFNSAMMIDGEFTRLPNTYLINWETDFEESLRNGDGTHHNLEYKDNTKIWVGEHVDPSNDSSDDLYNKIICIENNIIERGIKIHNGTSIFDYSYFYEMAGRLPRDRSGNFNFIVAVGCDEGTVPHFHVFWNEIDMKGWRNGACLMFTENAYYDYSNNRKTLNRKDLIALVSKLKENRKDIKITNWEYLIMLWNDNNEDYEIPMDTEVPDYDYKTIQRYDELKENKKGEKG